MNVESLKRWFITIAIHPLTKVAASLITLSLALLLTMDWIVMPLYTHHREEVETPNVSKMRYEDAKRIAEQEGFEFVREEDRYSDEFSDGYVIEQSPPPHAMVKSGRTIRVVISRGEKRVFVPSLLERSQRDAELLLARNRLTLGDVTYDFSNVHPEGVIIGQSVPPGTEVSINTRVNLVVSSGAEPSEFIVPQLEGRTFDDAMHRIKQAGLRLGQITYTIVPDLLPDTVIRQSVEPNTIVERGASIDLELSSLPGSQGEVQ